MTAKRQEDHASCHRVFAWLSIATGNLERQQYHAGHGGEVVKNPPGFARTTSECDCEEGAGQDLHGNGTISHGRRELNGCENHGTEVTTGSKSEGRAGGEGGGDGTSHREGRRTARPVARLQSITVRSQGLLKDSVSSEATQTTQMKVAERPTLSVVAPRATIMQSSTINTMNHSRPLRRRSKCSARRLAGSAKGNNDGATGRPIEHAFFFTNASRFFFGIYRDLFFDEDNDEYDDASYRVRPLTSSTRYRNGCEDIYDAGECTRVSGTIRTGTHIRRAGHDSLHDARAPSRMETRCFSPQHICARFMHAAQWTMNPQSRRARLSHMAQPAGDSYERLAIEDSPTGFNFEPKSQEGKWMSVATEMSKDWIRGRSGDVETDQTAVNWEPFVMLLLAFVWANAAAQHYRRTRGQAYDNRYGTLPRAREVQNNVVITPTGRGVVGRVVSVGTLILSHYGSRTGPMLYIRQGGGINLEYSTIATVILLVPTVGRMLMSMWAMWVFSTIRDFAPRARNGTTENLRFFTRAGWNAVKHVALDIRIFAELAYSTITTDWSAAFKMRMTQYAAWCARQATMANAYLRYDARARVHTVKVHLRLLTHAIRYGSHADITKIMGFAPRVTNHSPFIPLSKDDEICNTALSFGVFTWNEVDAATCLLGRRPLPRTTPNASIDAQVGLNIVHIEQSVQVAMAYALIAKRVILIDTIVWPIRAAICSILNTTVQLPKLFTANQVNTPQISLVDMPNEMLRIVAEKCSQSADDDNAVHSLQCTCTSLLRATAAYWVAPGAFAHPRTDPTDLRLILDFMEPDAVDSETCLHDMAVLTIDDTGECHENRASDLMPTGDVFNYHADIYVSLQHGDLRLPRPDDFAKRIIFHAQAISRTRYLWSWALCAHAYDNPNQALADRYTYVQCYRSIYPEYSQHTRKGPRTCKTLRF